ncbi:MAG: hypothetical protein RDU20_07195 [Desulfomonilaceae bacterium]|nr:hypothetical protein [Desulfomonilaceae bacterium]
MVDGFDLITILGLMKEYNWREIWKRYLPRDVETDSISLYVEAPRYFVEMHVQKMERIILSEKFNTNPFFMQQVIQRITASHAHDLILTKIRKQGIDSGDNPICLSCSLGNTIIDLIVNKNDPFPDRINRPYGNSYVERVEQRPLDIYDLSSTLYLCQQNLTEKIFRRYLEGDSTSESSERVVHISTNVGAYRVVLTFRVTSPELLRADPPSVNTSVFTIHQVLQRMNFRHAAELILKEIQCVGLPITLEQIRDRFTLSRRINNTWLEVDFTRS